jgi:hypothetical protein
VLGNPCSCVCEECAIASRKPTCGGLDCRDVSCCSTAEQHNMHTFALGCSDRRAVLRTSLRVSIILSASAETVADISQSLHAQWCWF